MCWVEINFELLNVQYFKYLFDVAAPIELSSAYVNCNGGVGLILYFDRKLPFLMSQHTQQEP